MKTVLITGGARRLGRSLVEHYARAGWRVLFTAQWSFKEGMELADSLGPNVHCVRAQVSSRSNAALVCDFVKRHADQLDLLICNASTFKRISVEDTTPDDLAGLLESNLIGPFFLIQQCLPLLRKARGNVINIGDAQATFGIPHFSAYAAAKAGLISITKSLAVELAPEIRVNAILPGTLEWPVDDTTFQETERAETIARTPLKRIGEWADIVEAAEYLTNAGFVTGTCLTLDGGRTASN